jgi:hypothetical protein
VRLRCLFSTGVPTAQSFNWTGSTASRFDSPPLVELGDGDGTVGERSLRVCTQWAQQQAEPVIVQRFVGISHSAMPGAMLSKACRRLRHGCSRGGGEMMRAGTRRVCVRLSAWLPVPRAAPRTRSWLTGTDWECRLSPGTVTV